jgi:hypothetical protein
MPQKNYRDFRKFFLLQFTKSLIENSTQSEIFKLGELIENEKKKSVREQSPQTKEIKNIMNRIPVQISRPVFGIAKQVIPRVIQRQNQAGPLIIPEPRLPSQFNYLRPTPSNVQIDLGKLNPLLKDPLVREIECSGAGENIIVRGSMGAKKTKIILNKNEVDDIIERVSAESKIPAEEGIYRVVLGMLMFSAIISGVISSKFIIKKIDYVQRMRKSFT